MKFKKFTFNLLSIMIGFHYGRNPATGDRFLHVAPIPFFGIDFYWPKDEAMRLARDPLSGLKPGSYEVRPLGKCPRGTPGCKYADCSAMPGHHCSGPDAPRHVDMLGGPGDRFEGEGMGVSKKP